MGEFKVTGAQILSSAKPLKEKDFLVSITVQTYTHTDIEYQYTLEYKIKRDVYSRDFQVTQSIHSNQQEAIRD